jgi:hypothetical protein
VSSAGRRAAVALAAGLAAAAAVAAAPPPQAPVAPAPPPYVGRPFEDEAYRAGAQRIPGIVQCALYDTGGEAVAYHDTDAVNHGSGELNAQALHQRPHAGPYLWSFRRGEGVDVSYVKDFADLNHPNAVSPLVNQLYIGWTADGEWVNYTVDVAAAGRYTVKALYSKDASTVTFDVDGKPALVAKLPVATENWHTWDYQPIGTIAFATAGRHRLTFHYGAGNNFAFFVFEPAT